MNDDHLVTVIANLKKDGPRMKFSVPFSHLLETLRKDEQLRLDMWFKSDTLRQHKPFYNLISMKLNKVTGKLVQVELKTDLVEGE